MTSSMVLCQSFNLFTSNSKPTSSSSSSLSFSKGLNFISSDKWRRRKRNLGGGFAANAKARRKKSWWYRFFLADDGNWLGLKENDMLELEEEVEEEAEEEEDDVDDDTKFEAWKRRAEAIVELREAQEDRRNEDSRSWEDWLATDLGEQRGDSDRDLDWDYNNGGTGSGGSSIPPSNGGGGGGEEELFPEMGLVKSVRNFLAGDDDDLLYEDRVFRYASINSAKFLAVLIIVPWALDFVLHDYVLMPFLKRYVEKVPLAAQILDVRRTQKLEIVEELKMEKARLQLEVEIGKAPPLNDDQLWWELRDKALELREERRLENRGAFANIWSDMAFGISVFILLYFNQSQVALLKFTGYKIINNISDTGKAFLIILITDIFLGYHSESGWQTLVEIIVEHYGVEVDQATITIFICLVPVVIDACVKLWLFKFLPRLSPKVSNLFREMKRH
ncbi:chloroplast envelope membrane protein isoform X1 [Cannabis sativa]|uniref:chloroplast envelope membrane protein isoform X1 n=1 Tax=Cannabis sativa TaxID=3483 RepID=UPI0029CA0839|nr:chloroplast envelope membrane protein isoform X1 [Cannabis sativa]